MISNCTEVTLKLLFDFFYRNLGENVRQKARLVADMNRI